MNSGNKNQMVDWGRVFCGVSHRQFCFFHPHEWFLAIKLMTMCRSISPMNWGIGIILLPTSSPWCIFCFLSFPPLGVISPGSGSRISQSLMIKKSVQLSTYAIVNVKTLSSKRSAARQSLACEYGIIIGKNQGWYIEKTSQFCFFTRSIQQNDEMNNIYLATTGNMWQA